MQSVRTKKGRFLKTRFKHLREENEKLNLNKSEQGNDTNDFVNLEGRRIVEIGTLANNLHCTECSTVLSLKNITEEQRFGFA